MGRRTIRPGTESRSRKYIRKSKSRVTVFRISPEAIKVAKAIWNVETGGTYDCTKAGQSGELPSCGQYLEGTWNERSTLILGYVAELTPTNDLWVTAKWAERLLNEGYTPYQIALAHNQGNMGKCRSGVNSYNVKYDSCTYALKVEKQLKQQS